MAFLIALVGVFAFVLIFRKALKKLPVVFYAVGIVLVSIYIYLFFFASFSSYLYVLLPLFQRCLVALAFFTLVMFAGVFPAGSFFRELLYPLRRHMSILGAIFACGHIAVYSYGLFPRFLTGGALAGANLTISLMIALAIALLLVPLTVTSFLAVKRHLTPEVWKRIQMLAYPFYLLTYLHLAIILMPLAFKGVTSAALNIIIYTVLFVLYLTLRIRRHILDASEQKKTEGVLVS